MFLELLYILSFILIPLIVVFLKLRISSAAVFLWIIVSWLPFLLELFEFIQFHVYAHYFIVLFLYVLFWLIVFKIYKSIAHKIIYIWFSVFLHLVCVIFLIFNHFIAILNSPTYTTIHDNIYAIETRNWWAWADENMVKVLIVQSFGILSIVKFSDSYRDSEIRYSYDLLKDTLDILMKRDDSWDFYKEIMISL